MPKRRMAVLVGVGVRVCEMWSSAGGCVCHVLSLLLPSAVLFFPLSATPAVARA